MSQLNAEQQGDDERLPNANEIGMGDEQDVDLTLIRRTQMQSIKGVRSQEKSNITRFTTKLNKLLQEQGSRTQISRALVAKIESQVHSADSFNRQLYALLPEKEHEQTQKWFMDVSHKAESAIVEAHAHLERRDEEPPSVLSGFAT